MGNPEPMKQKNENKKVIRALTENLKKVINVANDNWLKNMEEETEEDKDAEKPETAAMQESFNNEEAKQRVENEGKENGVNEENQRVENDGKKKKKQKVQNEDSKSEGSNDLFLPSSMTKRNVLL